VTPLLSCKGLSKAFPVRGGLLRRQTVKAVSNVDLELKAGEILSVVGESGSGKTTLARILLGLLPPSSGSVWLNGISMSDLGRRAIASIVQPVFQDPYSSLNPRRPIAAIVELPLIAQGGMNAQDRRSKSLIMLDKVGLPARLAGAYPEQLSGGQRQRVAIARALVTNPKIVLLDEPTSSLDVSVQAQILNLLMALRRDLGLAYILISHNLAVVDQIATRVAIMYLGGIVETGPAGEVFGSPRHPYTQALLASVLTPEPGLGIPDAGLGLTLPDPLNPPQGCAFHPRCPKAMAVCRAVTPGAFKESERSVSCHLYPQPPDRHDERTSYRACA
jgi:peptide/nickel transport system ATP-binding protein